MKRVHELRGLSDDHHTALVMARRCRRTARERPDAAPALWREVRATFAARLEPHFEIEERHLLPALDALGESALGARIAEDHAALRRLRDAASSSDAESLAQFGRILEQHVRFEEREVFEPMQHRLPAEALRAIARACGETPGVSPASRDGG